jgi:hypothetical protein
MNLLRSEAAVAEKPKGVEVDGEGEVVLDELVADAVSGDDALVNVLANVFSFEFVHKLPRHDI